MLWCRPTNMRNSYTFGWQVLLVRVRHCIPTKTTSVNCHMHVFHVLNKHNFHGEVQHITWEGKKPATKLVINVKKLHYEERLGWLKIPTLKYRRLRGDMIELHKIFAGKYDNNTTEWITGKCIEKHRFALQQSHVHYDIVVVVSGMQLLRLRSAIRRWELTTWAP